MPKLSEVMTRDVITVTPETTLREAVELFTAKHISGAPVVSGREVVGVVSASDILEFAAFAADLAKEPSEPSSWSSAASEAEEETLNEVPGSYYTDLYAGQAADVANRIDSPSDANVLDAHTVDEVMTHQAIALSPHDNLITAAEVMHDHSIHRVLVVDDNTLVGILSTLDLARAVAQDKLTTKTYVFNRDRDFGPSRLQRRD